jgi:hypothetical protein
MNLTTEGLSWIGLYCTSLQKLKLNVSGLTDIDLDKVFQSMQQTPLKELYIESFNSLKKPPLNLLPQLENLTLDKCIGIQVMEIYVSSVARALRGLQKHRSPIRSHNL